MQEREVSCLTSFPPSDLIKKQETELIKIKIPDGPNFQMAAFVYETNEDYLVHIIAVLHIIEQKGMASEIKVAWETMVEVRREMKPYFLFPEDKTKAAKDVLKQTLSKYKDILKAKKKIVIAETKRRRRCSIVLSSAIRKLSGTRLSTRCTPRTPGLA